MQCNLADALAMRATNRKTEPPGEFLDPHGKRLLTQGTVDLDPLILRLFVHTRANIKLRLGYLGIFIPENSTFHFIFVPKTL